MAAWSGHESLKEVEHYTRGVNRKNLLKRSVLVTGLFNEDLGQALRCLQHNNCNHSASSQNLG